ncbi:hypothetical protein LEP1GSC133_3203 [Leptospira borgpetersenii serovar Pomona str. 200901868]|uniref:Uncharacterized protein n=1 Tax=Leptospira borgpetersenii serovar Pomona str. 200901868 TaxID=1192866 RepID=M6WFB6_LEPBO|nr:hypothetical protein LEP1GSC133_3203 [Leptospira borgpetersenii serovar Pomona str. 200901868]
MNIYGLSNRFYCSCTLVGVLTIFKVLGQVPTKNVSSRGSHPFLQKFNQSLFKNFEMWEFYESLIIRKFV